MISFFKGKGRLLGVPRTWLNSLVAWVSGIHSPSGTINVLNTLDPSIEKSLGLDVNVDVVAGLISRRIFGEGERSLSREDVRDIVWSMLDGASLMDNGRRIAVSTEWLKRFCNVLESAVNPTNMVSGFKSSDGGSGVTASISGRNNATFTATGSGGSGVKVMLPTRICTDGEMGPLVFREFTINGSGQIVAIAAESQACSVYTAS